MIIVIDNYDSFVYNIADYISYIGEEVRVFRNDAIAISGIEQLDPDGIVISPGPGNPIVKRDFGIGKDILDEFAASIPILGICLGHQGIAHHFGCKVVKAKRVVHGKVDMIYHDGGALFKGIGNPFPAGRYHSLIVDNENFSDELKIDARTSENEIMAVSHRDYPIFGVQFHPESIMTPDGHMIIKNFMEVCGYDR